MDEAARVVISIELARHLRDAGVRWSPASGDRFVLPGRDMDDDVFVISDMTIEVKELVDRSVIGFNGTTEWAMDSVEIDDVLWLPREDQLRTLLGTAFAGLTVTDGGFRVDTRVGGREFPACDSDVERTYASALLAVRAAVVDVPDVVFRPAVVDDVASVVGPHPGRRDRGVT